MRVRMGAVAVLLLLTVLTGCSHSTTTDQGTTPADTSVPSPGDEARAGATGGPANVTVPDPCTLVTRDEAAKALGEASDANAIQPGGGLPGQRTCGYGVSASGKLVTIAVWPSDANAFTAVKTQAKTEGAPVSDVASLGDAAFLTVGTLYVHKGALAVSVYGNGLGSDDATKAALTSLATTALGRM